MKPPARLMKHDETLAKGLLNQFQKFGEGQEAIFIHIDILD